MRELEATVMATAAELGEMQDVHICALEEAVRLIKVTELREKEEELASSRASCTDQLRQSALGHEQTARDRIAHLSGEVAEGVQDQASLMLMLVLAMVQAELKTTELYFVLEALEWQLAQQQKEKEAAAARLRAGQFLG